MLVGSMQSHNHLNQDTIHILYGRYGLYVLCVRNWLGATPLLGKLVQVDWVI